MNSAIPRGSHPARRMICSADAIRFALVVAAELQHVAAGEDSRAGLRGARGAGIVAEHGAEQTEKAVRDQLLRDLIGGVALRDVRDLVRQHAGQLRFVRGRVQDAAMDPDRAARQRERVELAVVRDRKL